MGGGGEAKLEVREKEAEEHALLTLGSRRGRFQTVTVPGVPKLI